MKKNPVFSFRTRIPVPKVSFLFTLLLGCLLAQGQLTPPPPGGDVTVKVPNHKYNNTQIYEDAAAPNDRARANIDLVPSIAYVNGGPAPRVRILSVTGGVLTFFPDDLPITLGANGSVLTMSEYWDMTGGTAWYYALPLRFVPNANRTEAASFQYVIVHPSDNSVMSAPSTATIPIVPVNDFPFMSTSAERPGIFRIAYFYSTGLTGEYETRTDPQIAFYDYENFGYSKWTDGNYSIRWIGEIVGPYTGRVRFRTNSDDGVRLYLKDTLFISNWTEHGPTYDYTEVVMEAGKRYPVVLEFYERGGGEVITLAWMDNPSASDYVVVPASSLYSTQERNPITYSISHRAKIIDDSIRIKDADHAVLTGAQVRISRNFKVNEDVLSFTEGEGITGSYDAATGILTLTGTASMDAYRNALRSVRYRNITTNPSTDQRQVIYTVDDGEGYTPFFISRAINVVQEILPVSGFEVTARREASGVRIAWSTLSESNTKAFDVQRSPDGKHWQTFGRVAAARNSTSLQSYSFLDPRVPLSKTLYRLRQEDRDGKARYSYVVHVNGSGATGIALAANPVQNGRLGLKLSGNGNNRGALRIYNAGGTLVLEKKNVQEASLSIPVAGWSRGVYHLVYGGTTVRFVIP